MKKISIIVPCYNEQEALLPFWEEINKFCAGYGETAFEIIFVDDGSHDATLGILKEFSRRDKRAKFLSFSRNFGKEAAILAGLRASQGEYVAVMDADLQDPPSLLPEMLRMMETSDIDCVGTCRITRKGEPIIRSFFARMFYRLINMVSPTKLVDGARDFRMMRRNVVDALISMPEYHRFSKGLYEWVGFKTEWIAFENVERVAGETRWSFWKLLLYSIEGITAFTTKPLALASMLGLFFVLVSFASIIFLCVRQLCWHASVSGWTSMVCIMVFFSGIQLFCIGIIGQYLAKTYMEVKQRPHYVVKEKSM